MMTSTKVPHESEHVALGPVMLKDRYEVVYKQEHRKVFLSFADAAELKAAGWTRRGMHHSKKTDFWAHPDHSPRVTTAPEEVVTYVESRWGEREKVVSIVPVERTRWRHFTREEAFTLEGKFRPDVVQSF